MKDHKRPPRLFLRFFRWYCNPGMQAYIEGDLMEVYHHRLKTAGKKSADTKFIIDVLLLFRPGIIKPFRLHHPHPQNNLTMFNNYVKIAWRNIIHNKGYSFINIGGLAFGVAVMMLIGFWIYDEITFDKHNPGYHRIARVIQNVTNNGEVQTWETVPYPLAQELRDHYGNNFKRVAMSAGQGQELLTFEDKTIKQYGIFFEKEGPQILGLEIVQGTASFADPASVLLSATTAKTYFGDKDPLNKVMTIGTMPVVKVIGVYKDLPRNSRFAGLSFISTWDHLYNHSGMKTMEDPWRPNFTSIFVQLADDADFKEASARIKDAKLKNVNPQLAKKKPELFLHPMSKWHLYSEFRNGVNTGGRIQYVSLFSVISIFVLLLACINFMNLSTARNEKRAKEVGIRKTVGSDRAQVMFQFFGESLLTVLLSFVVAVILVQVVLPLFNTVADKNIEIMWSKPWFWLISAGFVLITSLIAGSYPALYLSSFRPIKVLKGTFKAGRYASVPRKALVVVQFTVSVALIAGTLIVYQQIQFAKDRPVGYSREGLINIWLMGTTIHDRFESVKTELLESGTVSAIAEAKSPTTAIFNSTSGISWKGKDPELSTDIGVVEASFGYGKTIGWTVTTGRDFSSEFATDSSAMILSEAAARFMNLENPVGEVIMWWGRPFTVIGVVEDMVMRSPYEEPKPVIYSIMKDAGNVALVRVNPSTNPRDAIKKVESVFKKFNPAQPFEYQFVDEEYAKKFGDEERIGTLASGFTFFAIIISCLGIFGLASFTTEQRTKEIGIRKILGASVTNLWHHLSREFVTLVVVSCLIAGPIAYYFLNDWLSKYQYRTEIEWWIFAAAGLSALSITMLIVSFHSIRAAVASPARNLRSE